MSNWYYNSQYNEYPTEFQNGRYYFDHSVNNGWEHQPFEGYGPYHGEPNYYPHANRSYEQNSSLLESTRKLAESTQKLLESTHSSVLALDFVLIWLFYVFVGVFGEISFCCEIGSKRGI